MQALQRHHPTRVADDEWQAPVPDDLTTSTECSCVQSIHEAERHILIVLDTLRESIARCEHALQFVAEARRQSTLQQSRSQTGQHEHLVTAPTSTGRLTAREVEVLRLIAAGRSNRQIADRLFLSPRTVERHIANIYLKIDAHSKAEATAYAQRHRLA